MKPLARFWNEEYGVDQPLEIDSWARRLVNKHVVAARMYTFPKTATRSFSRSKKTSISLSVTYPGIY